MYLLRILDLFALIGLFVQAFVAWVFVVVLASIRQRGAGHGAFRSFRAAFVALSLALTVMSVRFFRAHDVETSELWDDGSWLPLLCYAAYMGLKAWFCWLLVLGSHELSGRPAPRWLRSVRAPLIVLLAATPWLLPDIDDLLVAQAPVMIAASALSLRALRGTGTGLRLVRASLIGMAVAWTSHAGSVVLDPGWDVNPILSMNSFIDLAVQLLLGIGLVVCLLEDTHRRRIEAEQERERLRRSIERDERLRALGTVVSGVAHELNNPLTVILGYADLLRRRSPELRPARIIRDQAERCRGVVRSLSALAGQSVHPLEEVDVEALARRVVSGLPPSTTAGGRRVEIAPMDGLKGRFDRVGIEQVLANLVANGLQAGASGSTVTVHAARRDDALELRVEDEGPGVPAERRERIFEPFFTTKSPGRGTGLGLSIARAIVRGHGGSIEVEDRPGGRGTRFRVRLPQTGSPVDASAPTREPPPRSPAGRLLIIDDDAGVRAVMREAAEGRGWTVAEAASAEQALAAPLDEADAVLCDLRMPGIGGVGFHDRLAAERPDVLARVVFFTGDLASPETVRFSGRSERPLVEKPFDFDELFAGLAEIAAASTASRRRSRRLATGG